MVFYNIKTFNDNQASKGIYVTENTSEQNKQIKVNEDNNSKDSKNQINYSNNSINNDTEYKLFFGEWEVSKIVGQHQTLLVDINKAKRYLGKKVLFLQEKISFDNQVKITNPKYDLAVVPIINQDKSYIEKMPSLKEIGINGEYFIYVYVNMYQENYSSFLGDEFYIKDDKTLVAFYNDVYYELKRVSYIEDAEYGMTHV